MRVDGPFSRRLGGVLVLLALTAGAAAVVAGRQADITVSGRVVDAATGVPVPDAVVNLTGAATDSVDTSGGRFSIVLQNVTGRVRLSAAAPGYLRGFAGQRGAADNLAGIGAIDLAPGRSIDDVVIRLWREASISGRVVDHDDEPVAGASMLVMTQVFTGSGVRWSEVRASSLRTDDRGQFHVAHLLPGDYLVAVRPPVDPRAGADATPPVTYYPGTPVAQEAQVVPLMSGTDARLDLMVDFREPLGKVSGRLAGVGDFSGFFVQLVPERLLGAISAVPAVVVSAGMAPVGGFAVPVAPDGTFTFRAVPRGAYRVKSWRLSESGSQVMMAGDLQWSISGTSAAAAGARRSTSSDVTLSADVPLVVEDDASIEVVVPLSAGARVRGRLAFDGVKAPGADEMAAIPLFVRPADGAALGPVPAARIEADGSFASSGLPPGEYVISLGILSGRIAAWTAASILAEGREVVAGTVSIGARDIEDVVIRMTDRPTSLTGTLRDSRGQSVPDGRVIVFPVTVSERDQYHAATARRRVVQVLADREGRFVASVPSGEYFVAAVSGDLPAFWMAPEHLATLAAVATAVRVPEGRETSVNVTLR